MLPWKRIVLTGAVVLGFGSLGVRTGWGQATCFTGGAPTLVRAEGLTEIVGVIFLSGCTGAIPPSGASLTVTMFPAQAVVTNSPAAGFAPTAVVVTTAGIGAPIAGSISGNTVTFALPPTPGGASLISVQVGGTGPGLGGIRVNATALGAGTTNLVTALLTVNPVSALAITNPQLTLATPNSSLTASISTGAGLFQGAPPDLVGVPDTASFFSGPTPIFSATDTQTGDIVGSRSVPRITVRERFPTVFLVAGAPAAGNGEGLDSSGIGTRLLIRFSQFPENVVVYAPQRLSDPDGTFVLNLVSGADSSGANGAPLLPGAATTANRVSGTTITYEVTASRSRVEEISIPLGFFTTGIPTPPGPIPATVSLAPVSTVATPVVIAQAPIPRFVDVPLPLTPPSFSLNPMGLSFAAAVGANPPDQLITLTNSGGGTLNWTAQITTFLGGNWLSLSATTGTAPSNLTVSVNSANLAAGTYQARIEFNSTQAVNSPRVVNVTLIVGTPSFSFSRNSLLFTAAAGGNPAAQTFQVQNAGTGTLNWTAAAATQSGGNWLSISPTTGTAPSTVTVTVQSAALAPGSYAGTITFTTPTGVPAGNSPQVVTVALSVGNAPVITQNGVVNGASFAGNAFITPGATASVFGVNLAPSAQTVQAFPLPTSLLGARVLVNGTAAFLFFVGPSQINFQVPFGLTGTTAQIVVESGGVQTPSVTVNVAPELPGIYTFPSGGSGQGVIVNQDSTFNSPQNPAAIGSVVAIFATGLGPVNPPIASGQSAPVTPLSHTLATPEILIGGASATDISFSGLVPGTAGGYQVNVRIPASAPVGDIVTLQIRIGTRTSNTVTIAIR